MPITFTTEPASSLVAIKGSERKEVPPEQAEFWESLGYDIYQPGLVKLNTMAIRSVAEGQDVDLSGATIQLDNTTDVTTAHIEPEKDGTAYTQDADGNFVRVSEGVTYTIDSSNFTMSAEPSKPIRVESRLELQ